MIDLSPCHTWKWKAACLRCITLCISLMMCWRRLLPMARESMLGPAPQSTSHIECPNDTIWHDKTQNILAYLSAVCLQFGNISTKYNCNQCKRMNYTAFWPNCKQTAQR